MMNKIFLVITLMCITLLEVNAQVAKVEISPPLQQNNRMSLNDLLQFYVQSDADDPLSVYLQLVIEKQDNGIVSVLKTDLFELAKGIINAPVLVGYNGSKLQIASTRIGFENIKQSDFKFPEGRYNYCIELRDREGTIIHKDCASFEAINPRSFFLVYPFDHQELQEDRPTFTWTPLLSSTSQNINYRIRWVEHKEQTNPQKAFYNSPDFFEVLKVRENILPYKIEYPEFDPKKYYYWQVEAYTGRTILAKSDIWEFHFEQEKAIIANPISYVKADLEHFTKLHLFSGDDLNFEWINYYNPIPLEYKILDFNNNVIFDQSGFNPGIAENGKNRFQIDVSGIIELNKVYTLLISGSKRDYKIKFKKI